jgi:hypothetical protein
VARLLALLAGSVSLFALLVWLPFPAATASLTNCSIADHSMDTEELAFLSIINDYRAANGASPLTLSENLNRAAAWMATDMAMNNRFGHIDSLGRHPYERTMDCGYPVGAGENLAAGSRRDTAAAAFELFRNSPSHNSNMLLPHYQKIGIARVHYPGSRYTWYWGTNFGTVDDSAVAAPPPSKPAQPASNSSRSQPPPALLHLPAPSDTVEDLALLERRQVAAPVNRLPLVMSQRDSLLAGADALVARWSSLVRHLPAGLRPPLLEGRDGSYRLILR